MSKTVYLVMGSKGNYTPYNYPLKIYETRESAQNHVKNAQEWIDEHSRESWSGENDIPLVSSPYDSHVDNELDNSDEIEYYVVEMELLK